MTLISPDVIAELKGLSVGAGGFLLLVGFLLWGFGWRWHRFWVVFGFTAAAGIVGMTSGKAAGGHILVMGLLLAFAGGVLAIELAKLLSFVAGGIGCWLAVQAVIPQAQELWAVFLAGGLFGVLLYRLWTMILMSLLGVLVSWHAAFSLAQSGGSYDAVKWVTEHSAAVNSAVIVVTLLGVLMQTVTAEKATKKAEGGEKKASKSKHEKHEKHDSHDHSAHKEASSSWWKRLPGLKAA
ncbi:hypothetical protein [Limnoglobus roseus]|uniref:TMEM198/TM7SF3 family protein n=1 Tax=Limnoglobus roseus TaxID=2598579 RepID=A0A5C1API7_9BACT|nr:hypothetical protein [Limnoglobus roseus]QEL19124.1 hypothetical protein PX52LOC_06181 [Limnoglobus roseus]